MDWTAQLDGYCERIDPSFWAEPLNAVTNAAFVLVAMLMWGRARSRGGRVLCAVLAVIGVGSFLFHTLATVWASLADTGPIAVFVLSYLYLANRDFLGWSRVGAVLGLVAAIPAIALATPLLARVPFIGISAMYWPVVLLIASYGVALARRAPELAGGLWLGAGILTLSLVSRSIDGLLCPVWPVGTHMLWHVLNAAMLGWMIELHARVRDGRTPAA